MFEGESGAEPESDLATPRGSERDKTVDIGPTTTEPEPDHLITDETGDDFEDDDDEDEVMRQHLALVEAHMHLFNP